MNFPLFLTALLTPAMAFSQIVINDSWSDANRAKTGALDADWWSSSSTSANSVEVYTGQLGLVTGTSGRGLHGTFAPQTLGIGDTLTATLTFTTPATVGAGKGGAFKFALMDFNNPGLAADLSSSSSSVNPLYVGQPGYMFDFDVNTGSEADTTIRKHNVASGLGRFLGTTDEWDRLGGSGEDDYSFAPDTEYVVVLFATRTDTDSMDLSSSLMQGATLLSSHTETDSSSIANNIGMLGVWVNSNTFGSTNSHGETEDNGITLSKVTVELSSLAVIPEPSAFAALFGLFAFGMVLRRRRA